MRNIRILLLFTAVFITTTARIFAGGEAETSGTVRIGILPDVDSVPFVIAQQKGYFESEGAEVELQQFMNPVSRDTAFQAGETDAVISDLLAAALSLNGGFDVKAAAMTSGSYKLLVSPGNRADSVADLDGMGIGISKNTIIEYALDRILESEGLPADYTGKEVIPQIPVRLEMLSADRIDGAVLAEPLATVAAGAGCRVLVSTDELGINPGIFLVDSSFMETERETLRAVFRAYNRAVNYLESAPRDEYIGDLVDTMKLPRAAEQLMKLPEYHPAAAVPADEVREVQKWLTERSLISREFSYSELADTSCLP